MSDDVGQVLETIIEEPITALEVSEVASSTNVEENVVDTNDDKFGEGPYPLVCKDQATQSVPTEELLALKHQLEAVTTELEKYKIREELVQKEENDEKNGQNEIAKKFKLSPRYICKICGQNKLMLVIPCHRVIRSDGALGGFSSAGGLKLKKKLLMFEKNWA